MFLQVHLNVMFSTFELSTNGNGNRLNLSTIKDISCENADVLLPKLLSSVVFFATCIRYCFVYAS